MELERRHMNTTLAKTRTAYGNLNLACEYKYKVRKLHHRYILKYCILIFEMQLLVLGYWDDCAISRTVNSHGEIK